jgi:hypothetical protein
LINYGRKICQPENKGSATGPGDNSHLAGADAQDLDSVSSLPGLAAGVAATSVLRSDRAVTVTGQRINTNWNADYQPGQDGFHFHEMGRLVVLLGGSIITLAPSLTLDAAHADLTST